MARRNRDVVNGITKGVNGVLNVLIVVGCFILVVSVYSMWQSIQDAKTSYYTASSFSSNMKPADYYRVAYYTKACRMASQGDEPDFQTFYAVGDYFDDTILYQALEQTGDAELAEHYAARREQDRQKMGGYAAAAQEIDRVAMDGMK